jgi:molecular chaperone GrpE
MVLKKKVQEGKKRVGKNEIKELKDQLVRALADYDNLRKRVEKERGDFKKLANLTLVAKLLPVFDMLEEAQMHLKDSGIAIIIKELTEVFEEEGVERIKVDKGVKFDENLHEAVEVAHPPVSKKGKGNKIVKELVSGWKYKDGIVIRPVGVKVAKSNKQ